MDWVYEQFGALEGKIPKASQLCFFDFIPIQIYCHSQQPFVEKSWTRH